MGDIYNIYCDESCHLQYDNADLMVQGAIMCPENIRKKVYEEIRGIKEKHNLNTRFEIKWTKVSISKIEFYLDLLEYFFDNKYLSFRGVIATNKSKLDHSRYNNGDYNLWYYKMYYQLLDPMIHPSEEYKVYIDIKDTKGGSKVKKLQDVLCNNVYDFKQEVIKDVKQINSKESELLQLADLLIGSLSYYHRGLYKSIDSNQGKNYFIEVLRDKYSINLLSNTSRYESKFNLFIWKPRGWF